MRYICVIPVVITSSVQPDWCCRQDNKLVLVLTQERSHAGQDGEQGGRAEPRRGQRGLLRETHRLPLPVPLPLRLLVLLLLPGTRPSSQAGADGHGDRAGAGEPRRAVPQDQRDEERVAGGRRAGQGLELGQQHQAGRGAWRESQRQPLLAGRSRFVPHLQTDD